MNAPVGAMVGMALGACMMLTGMPAAARSAQMAREDVRATADCAVEQDHRLVADLFKTLPGSADERHGVHRLNTVLVACLGGDRRITDDAVPGMRAALAVALVTAAVPGMPRGGEPWYRSATIGKTAHVSYDPARLGALEFGSCVMAAAPGAAVALVRAEPGGADERGAIDALRPVVGPCMTQGATLRLKADDLRWLLAEPVYHATAG